LKSLDAGLHPSIGKDTEIFVQSACIFKLFGVNLLWPAHGGEAALLPVLFLL